MGPVRLAGSERVGGMSVASKMRGSRGRLRDVLAGAPRADLADHGIRPDARSHGVRLRPRSESAPRQRRRRRGWVGKATTGALNSIRLRTLSNQRLQRRAPRAGGALGGLTWG